eukprot:CAMPEP_0201564466 /NCGR_PEP_ID=MMETSP0190_2-20130828/2766_1 /ASSEMBLY_ACC=CAM_ASM_000263 /TAXON_ID=37353 /ORGANISM="Rosalina sp." /LENGTH=211 /DNA_ID=CAMNT_0047980669 /DNA_START=214 /DNA_END=846 /DNA_ORIENTATION=+
MYDNTFTAAGVIDTPLPYYTPDEFEKWLANDEDYASEAKDYLIKVAQDMDLDLTREQLNSGGISWDEFEANYWKSAPTAENEESSIFKRFSLDTWHAINANDFVLYPNRRCYDEDYSESWRDVEAQNSAGETVTVRVPNLPPPFCNNDQELYEFGKPRTWVYDLDTPTAEGVYNGRRSLFPMHTRTRVESLAMSNSAYFISIIVVQWADLM